MSYQEEWQKKTNLEEACGVLFDSFPMWMDINFVDLV